MSHRPEPQRARRWPRRWAYIAAAFPVALILSVGLLALETTLAHTAPGVSHVRAALAHPELYGYVFLSTALALAGFGFQVGRKQDRLERLSITDPLTGLANRRRLQSEIIGEMNRADRYDTPLALLLIDLDRLKHVNDRFGHPAGDRALQTVAEALRQSCRTTDLAARHGGDEFAVLAVNTTAAEALALAQRILDGVRRFSVADLHLTVSIGVSDLERAAVAGFDGLHASADEALYQAKAQGGNVAVAAPERARQTPPRLRLVTPLETAETSAWSRT